MEVQWPCDVTVALRLGKGAGWLIGVIHSCSVLVGLTARVST